MELNNIFKGQTANEVWLKAFKQLDEISNKPQESRIGLTHEILHAFISIKDPRQRWITARKPAFNIAFAIAEIVWIMNGRNDSEFLNFWNSKLPEYAGKGPEYHGAYGHRLRKNFGFDQLDKAYYALKNNPKSRQVVLQIWEPSRDFPDKEGIAVNADIPCNIISLIKVRDGKLEWQQIMRSNDIILGLPYNLIQFTTIQEIMAGWLELEVGTYNHLSDSLHLYLENHNKYGISKEIELIQNVDDLRLKKSESEKIFKEFSDKIDSIVVDNYSEKDLKNIFIWDGAPESYGNLLSIICAEAARKAEYYELSNEFILKCKNPLLVLFWKQWMKRFSIN
ncbi:MAG: thymidylate synthase [Balneolaceae bacterium]